MDYMTSLGIDPQFQNLKSSRDRIEFILKYIRPLSEFYDEMFRIGDNFLLMAQKSADKSKSFLNEGLKFYGDGNYRSAIRLFIKAILLAPYPLEEHISDNCLSIAFAYKALAEFQLKDYKNSLLSACNSLYFLETNEMLLLRIHCLRILKKFSEALQILDRMIEKSENTGPNGEVTEQGHLNSIKQYIIRQMAKSDNPSSVSLPESANKISDLKAFGAQEMIDSTINVWVHPSCQLKCTEEKGRHFIVDHFIPKDTVLLVERPASVVIYKEKTKKYCLNCWKPIRRQIWPCIGCNEVVFCSKECFVEGFDNFHQYECGILSVLFRFGNNFPHLFRFISRVGVRKAFECENENKNFDFKSYIESHKKDEGKPSSNTEKNSFYETEYKAFHSMTNHYSQMDKFSDIFLIFRSIEMAILFDYTKQLDFDIEEDFQLFVELVNICLIEYNRLQMNVFGWYCTPPQQQKRLVGCCQCTVASLFNHSCEPNIFWGFRDQKVYFKAVKDINEGEEMTITYGPTFRNWDFIERQKKLKLNYFFDCNCKACLRDCQTVLCIKCEQCLGAVVHRVSFPPHIERDYCCLHCGHKYRPKDLKKSILEIEDSFKIFTQMMTDLDNNYNIELSLNMAEKSLNSLLRLAYNKCQPLRDSIRQMVRVYALHDLFGEALQYVKHFDYHIESDENSMNGDILDDLLLLTDCYYMYLNENKVNDTNHWNMCFQLYSKLIEVLKRAKKLSKKIKTDDKQSVNTQTLRTVIKDKEEELKQLKESFQSLVNKF